MYDGRFYKIGKSKDPKKRLKEFQTANPSIELVSYYEGDIEILCHQKFWKNRIKNEWFNFNNEEFFKVLKFMNLNTECSFINVYDKL